MWAEDGVSLASRPKPQASSHLASSHSRSCRPNLGLSLLPLPLPQPQAIALALAPHPRLVSDGWYARTRNPNYLGEMLLYASFAVLGQTTFMWTHLLLTWSTTFLPNMWWKERSLMRKPGWEAWAARSGFLLPALLPRGPAATAATARPTAPPTAKRAKASPKRAPSSKR